MNEEAYKKAGRPYSICIVFETLSCSLVACSTRQIITQFGAVDVNNLDISKRVIKQGVK